MERTAAVLVEAPGGLGNVTRAARWDDPPAVGGTPVDVATALRRFADAGADHLQLVVDPITVESVDWLGGVLERLRS